MLSDDKGVSSITYFFMSHDCTDYHRLSKSLKDIFQKHTRHGMTIAPFIEIESKIELVTMSCLALLEHC